MVLGFVFIVFGVYVIFHPRETFVLHPGTNRFGLGTAGPEKVSKRGSQIYGGLAAVMGGGLCCLACYRGHK